jgi:hypothetical protein
MGRVNMVEIECPHCVEVIELNDDDFGSFECPFCEEQFECNRGSKTVHEDLFSPSDFFTGLMVPFLPSCFGIFLSYTVFNGWDSLIVFALSVLLWPIVAIGFIIYGQIKMRKYMVFGTTISLTMWLPVWGLLSVL